MNQSKAYCALLLIFIVLITLIGCGVEEKELLINSSGYDVVTPWEVSTPEAQGIDRKVLTNIVEEVHNKAYKKIKESEKLKQEKVSKEPQVESLIVIKNGYKVKEYYREGGIPPYNNHSVTKSITGLLVGIAIEEGYIKGVNQKIIDFFPELKDKKTSSKMKEIRIKHLLQMTSGFEWNEHDVSYFARKRNDWIKMKKSYNPLEYIFNKSMVAAPGEKWSYNTGNSHILSAIIQRATEMKTEEFAWKKLFDPLEMKEHLVDWSTDKQGVNFGGADLELHTEELAKIGYLCLNKGKWKGKQIVPQEWIKKSFNRTKKVGGKMKYGYQWWRYKENGFEVSAALGSFGQGLFIVPELNLIVALNSTYRRPEWGTILFETMFVERIIEGIK